VSNLNIASVVFEGSFAELDSCPDDLVPEFAFIGRSNVGKSSLLNLLSGQKDLAKVSSTPGHTKLINFFLVDRAWRLVDLPGYGFAQVARADKAKFNRAVNHYLEHRPNLRGVFVLIDSSLPPQKIDLEFLKWLAVISAPVVLVFTKTDRVGEAKLRQNIAALLEAMSEWCESKPEVFTCSARERTGRNELLGAIGAALREDDDESDPSAEG
jgi:GTP-binding protein